MAHKKKAGRPQNHTKVASGASISYKTRRSLPSEAFVKELKSTTLPSTSVPKVESVKTLGFRSPQRGLGGEKKSVPRSHINTALFNSVVDKFTNPAPIQIGGATRKPLSYSDLKQAKEKICKERQERREVLFALKKAGKGSNVKEAKWTLASLVRCN